MEQEEQALGARYLPRGVLGAGALSLLPAWPRSTSNDLYFGPYKILSVDGLTQNQTLGLSCLDGYSKSRPDSVEEHARTAEYRRTLQRLRVVIRTLNRDCTKYCVKYSVHYALLLLLLCIIVLCAHSSDCVMEQQDLAKVLELLVAGNTISVR